MALPRDISVDLLVGSPLWCNLKYINKCWLEDHCSQRMNPGDIDGNSQKCLILYFLTDAWFESLQISNECEDS